MVEHLCDRVVLLESGQVTFAGDPRSAFERYLSSGVRAEAADVNLRLNPSRRRGCSPVIAAVRFKTSDGVITDRFRCGEAATIELDLEPVEHSASYDIGIGIEDFMGARVASIATYLSAHGPMQLSRPVTVVCDLPQLPLLPGRYSLSLSAGPPNHRLLDALDSAVSIEVEAADFFGTGQLPSAGLGKTLIRSNWTTSP
jgi:lipopolysaccharide transport system ATP-binding protein